jgi:hypothetical protein
VREAFNEGVDGDDHVVVGVARLRPETAFAEHGAALWYSDSSY